MKQQVRTALGGIAALTLLAGCGESSTEPGGESELITRVTLTLTPAGGGTAITSVINDPDGNGPQAPAAQSGAIVLARNTTYTGTIRFENALENPPEDITREVQEEANEHRVFYAASGQGVTVTTTDTDGQGRPLGLRFSKALGATPTAGTLQVVLCHYDAVAKPAQATACTAETDINVSFAYTIQN